ncbi:MAG: hypothetical protein ACW99U_16480 [Candidatus Thorarchaeota archaeon]
MGWCSGTDLFDDIAGELFSLELDEEVTREKLRNIIIDFQNNDWDCEQESMYAGVPIFDNALKEADEYWRKLHGR